MKSGHGVNPTQKPRVALIDVLDPRNRDDRENIGQALIAAHLRAQGVEVEMISLTLEERAADRSEWPRCLLYGFSFYPNTADAVYAHARRIKSLYPDSHVCVGGRLATDACVEILADCPEIDFSVLGEAEAAMGRIVQVLQEDRPIGDLGFVQARGCDPKARQVARHADFPSRFWPVRDLLSESLRRGNRTARINASLGCAACCAFCSVNSFMPPAAATESRLPADRWKANPSAPKKRWRGRPVEDVLKEIQWLNESRGVQSFVFNDASFEDPGSIGKRRIRRLCEGLIGLDRNLAFRCSMRSESFKSKDGPLLDLMRRAGFTNVFLGVESGSNEDLDVFKKIADKDDNHQALALFESKDIDVTMGFIMFHPASTWRSLIQNCRFLTGHGASRAHHFLGKIDVYFGTDLHRRLKAEGLLSAEFSYRNPHGYRYADPAVSQLDAYLSALRTNRILTAHDGRMIHLSYTMSELKALFGDMARPYAAELESLRRRSAAALADFFVPLFTNLDRLRTRRRQPSFLAEMATVSEGLRALGLNLLYCRDFRGYLFGAARRAS